MEADARVVSSTVCPLIHLIYLIISLGFFFLFDNSSGSTYANHESATNSEGSIPPSTRSESPVKVEAKLILIREGFESESFGENKLLSPRPSSGGLFVSGGFLVYW